MCQGRQVYTVITFVLTLSYVIMLLLAWTQVSHKPNWMKFTMHTFEGKRDSIICWKPRTHQKLRGQKKFFSSTVFSNSKKEDAKESSVLTGFWKIYRIRMNKTWNECIMWARKKRNQFYRRKTNLLFLGSFYQKPVAQLKMYCVFPSCSDSLQCKAAWGNWG